MSWEELVRLSEDIASSPLMPEISSDVHFINSAVQYVVTTFVCNAQIYCGICYISGAGETKLHIASSPLMPEISSDVQLTRMGYNMKVTCYT